MLADPKAPALHADDEWAACETTDVEGVPLDAAPQAAARVLANVPGAVLLLAPLGDVHGVWQGPHQQPLVREDALGRAVHEALGLAEDADEAVLLQLWLASVDGTDTDGWALHRDDAPAACTTESGVPLALDYAPVFVDGEVQRVVLSVHRAPAAQAAAAPSHGGMSWPPHVDRDEAETFLGDARGLLTECEAAATRLAADPHARHAIAKLFRSIHTLKGNARTLGLTVLEHAAHTAEDSLDALRGTDAPVTAEQVEEIWALVGELRDLVGALPVPARAAPAAAEQPHDAPLASLRDAIVRCARAATAGDRDAALRALDYAVESCNPTAALLEACAELQRTFALAQPAGAALARLEAVAAELDAALAAVRRCKLPEHLAGELAVASTELRAASRAYRDRPSAAAASAIRHALYAIAAAADSFGLERLAQSAITLRQDLDGTAIAARSADQLSHALAAVHADAERHRAMALLVPQRERVDVFGRFYGEAQRLVSFMKLALESWSVHVRNSELLEALYDATVMYTLCARRYRFGALVEHAGDMLQLLLEAKRSARPQRSLVARGEQWLTDVEAHLQLYHAFITELRSAPDGAALLARMEASGETGPETGIEARIEWLADEAEAMGILSLRATLSQAGALAPPRITRLLTDLDAFTAEPSRAGAADEVPLESRARDAQQALESLSHALDRLGDLPAAVQDALAEARRTVRALTGKPIAALADRVTRMAGELASDLGKRVAVRWSGEALLVEPALLPRVSEILLHAIRNALDHGIEHPDERRDAGKPGHGTIDLQFAEDDGQLLIVVSDDGRGVDVERVRTRAVERGLMDSRTAARASDDAIVDLLFHPGLSTAAAITTVSGRGVGMDAIRSAAEELGGNAVLSARPGLGTRLTVTLGTRTGPVAR